MSDGAVAALHPWSQVMAGISHRDGALELTVPDDWMQGRTVFGGLQAAFAVHAMRELVRETPLRTLQATFIAPVANRMRATATVLRTGKNATHVEARLLDGDLTLALLVGVFGAARPSVVRRLPEQRAIEISDAAERFTLARTAPAFTRHFRPRWKRGSPPFAGVADPELVVEVDVLDEGPTTEGHVLAIADYIPPIGLAYLPTFAPGATMTWMLEMLVEQLDGLPLQGWRIDAELHAAGGGYTSQSAVIWGPGGVPVALSRQSMVVFG